MPELVDLEIAELSLVEKPANKRSPLVLKGLSDEEETTVSELAEVLLETEAENEEDLNEVLRSQDVEEDGRNALVGAYRLVNGHLDELPDEARKEFAEVALGIDLDENTDDDVDKDLEGVADPEARDKIRKLKERLDEQEKESLRKDAQEWASEIEALPVEKGDLADLLFRLEQEAGSDLREDVEQMLKSADEQAREADVFEEVGTSESEPGGDAWSRIEEKAEEMVEDGKAETKQKAVTKVLDQNPDLYADYDRETRS